MKKLFYRLPVRAYRRALGTLHPSCTLPDGDVAVGDTFELREHDSKRDEETGNVMFVTASSVARSRASKTRPGSRVRFAVNRLAGR